MIARRQLPVIAGGLLAAPSLARAQNETLRQGFSPSRLDRFAPAMAREIERGSFLGAVGLIARNGEVVHHQAYGHQDMARQKPMALDSIFLLASMTKPLTSVATMMMIEEGRLSLRDPIVEWMPELRNLVVHTPQGDQPLARPITVQDLLRHSSGFVYADAAPERIRDLYNQHNIEAREQTLAGDEMLRRLGTIPLAFQPGERFFYSISTDVLGLLLERVAGERLDRLLESRITGPLGMKDTVWWVDDARAPRLAEAPDSDPLKASMWASYRIRQDNSTNSYLKGGAGMVGTSADYHRFCQMLLDGGSFEGRRYLSPTTVRFMMSNHIVGMGGSPAASTGPGYGFGLGFGVRLADGMGVAPGSPGDAMWAGAWGTSFTIDRAQNLVGVFMAQGPSNRVRTRMLFKNLVYGSLVDEG
ncbi:serine hydrolase domain-containing protein [Sabulicella rubraurantiaca]|uniref:serine hydrolase domain-containing protein n=1 Tax=Sabulicella rubraurantiaca TaxID=2811429 RepID=UPI001A95C665|nr:serine hydrolase domain-containing protein [Sabulicella rubraurantiaca]